MPQASGGGGHGGHESYRVGNLSGSEPQQSRMLLGEAEAAPLGLSGAGIEKESKRFQRNHSAEGCEGQAIPHGHTQGWQGGRAEPGTLGPETIPTH
jgi:hypothetical protein